MENQTKIFISLLKNIADQQGQTDYQISKATGIGARNLALYWNHTTVPSLDKFLKIAKAVNVNIFFEAKDSETDLNQAFEKAMTELGRRPNNLPEN